MLDIRFIRDNLALVKKAAQDKNFAVDWDRLLAVDEQQRQAQTEWETLQAERNALSKQIGAASPADREPLKQKVGALKPRMEELDQKVKELKQEFDSLMLRVPAPARADVPLGKDDKENVEIKKVGTPPQFDFQPLDHVALGEKHNIIDIPRGVKVAGSRSYILKGDGARLEAALMNYTLTKLMKKGYTTLSVPVLVNEEAMVGTGYFPLGYEQAYICERDNKALVGTAEVTMASMHADEILPEAQLPLRYAAQSTCFRREAGTYGKDTHGLYRVHQFQKIEQVIIAPADENLSEQLHAELLNNAEEVLQDLGLAYRVVYVCTGDLGQGQVRKHDVETWMPSRKAYSETHSCSTFHDFQARRLKIRYKTADGKNLFAYTLNNTAIASPRALIPLLENHQLADGRIKIPEVLRPYMGGQEYIG